MASSAALDGTSADRRRRRRVWRFGGVVFDEASWSLIVDGVAVPLEAKPFELLHELCLRAGETVSKDELLDTVWGGVNVVENSIPTAVAKLRRALGPGNAAAVATVSGIGYRLAVPVVVETVAAPRSPRFAFVAGDAIPGRPQWRLVEPLGDGGAADVWRGRHEKTGEMRVFKFADAPDRLRSLRREAAVSRLLLTALGTNEPFVRLLEWNFETAPFFLETRDSGLSLIDWARAAGGLAALPLDRRIDIAARAARALASVHGVGVIHQDIKPANILVEAVGEGAAIRLADFGSGRADDAAFSAYAITVQSDPADEDGREGASGTPFYRAPELAAGAVPTVASDVYALGLVLFQLAVGDFGRVPAPGWEREVADPLLRADIAAAAAGDPDARIESAAALADRLETIEARRREAAAAEAAAARLAELARRDARRRARRPWAVAAGLAVALGIAGTTAAALVAVRQRDEARQQQAIADASYKFLANDLLASADPYHASAADESIATAARRASAEIDRRFDRAPLIAAGLHHSLARAFDQRTELDPARIEYAKADRAFTRAGRAGARDRRISLSQWAQLEALSGDAGKLPRALALLARARVRAALPDDPETAVWLQSASGSIALAGEDVHAAQAAYLQAAAGADRLPQSFDERQRLNLHQRLAFIALRVGDGAAAQAQLQPLLAAFARLEGLEHPDTLNIQLNLIQALLVQHRYPDVVAQATSLLPVMERRLGFDHRRTLQVLAVRQQALGNLERYAEAARDGERVWRATAAHEGANAFQAVAGRADTAESQCRAGDHAAGLDNARAALVAARTSGPETALSMAVRATLASCLISAGHPVEAAPLLARIDRQKVSELVGDARWGANLDLALAQVLVAQGQVQAAREHWVGAVQTLSDRPDAYQRRLIGRIAILLKRRSI